MRVTRSPLSHFTTEVVRVESNGGQCANGGYGNGLKYVQLSAVIAFQEEEVFVVGHNVGGIVCPPRPSLIFPFGEALSLKEGLIDHNVLRGIVEEVVRIPFLEPFGDV